MFYGILSFLDGTKHNQGIAEIKSLPFDTQEAVVAALQATKKYFGYFYSTISIYDVETNIRVNFQIDY